MARLDGRPVRRTADRRTASLLATSLAVGMMAAVAMAPGWATAVPTVTRVGTLATDPTDPGTAPGGEPGAGTTPPVEPTATAPGPTTAPPTESAPPETTPPPPATTEPVPVTTAPGNPVPTTTAATTTAPPPVVVPPPAPGPGKPAPGRPGVLVTTEDVSLTGAYWNAASTVTSLRVTVTNTGTAPELVRLGYTLPGRLSDAGTPGCASAGGGSYRCGEWTTAPGARFSTLVRVRVDGAAWRRVPLSGSVRVSATVPGVSGSAEDDQGFAVLFPPGPPVPGMALHADEVAFDITGGASELGVRLGNTGKVDAAGRIEVVLPAGVAVSTPPPGCVAPTASRTRCELGTVPAGQTATLRLPVTATPEAQRQAPLAGALTGRLDPRSGRTRQMQMSFRITAAAAVSTTSPSAPAPTGSQGLLVGAGGAGGEDGDGLSSARPMAVILITVSALLVVLALALATTSLRRRMADPAPDPAGASAASD